LGEHSGETVLEEGEKLELEEEWYPEGLVEKEGWDWFGKDWGQPYFQYNIKSYYQKRIIFGMIAGNEKNIVVGKY
jgi:hypothetical protein